MYNGSKFVFKTFYQIVKYLISRKGYRKKKTKRDEFSFLSKNRSKYHFSCKRTTITEGKVTQHLFSLKHAHIIQLSPEGEVNSGVDIPKVYI